MKPAIIITAIAALALTGCSSAPTATPTPTRPATFTASGFMDLSQTMLGGKIGDQCSGRGGYSDMSGGTQVKISDASGKIIALGALDYGKAASSIPETGTTRANICRFTFSVPGVPAGQSIYGVEVGKRGVINFSESQAGSLALTLG